MTLHRHHLLAAAIAAALLAGCGAGSNSTTSSGSSDPPTQAQLQQTQREVVRFAGCMRTHGAPNLPDPTSSPRAFKASLGGNQSPAVRAALRACRHLLPGGPSDRSPARTQAQRAAILAFARCLRSHGFPRFPDPTSTGEVTHEMLANAGIDLHQPAVVHAANACVGVTHGVITKAAVVRFIAGR